MIASFLTDGEPIPRDAKHLPSSRSWREADGGSGWLISFTPGTVLSNVLELAHLCGAGGTGPIFSREQISAGKGTQPTSGEPSRSLF